MINVNVYIIKMYNIASLYLFNFILYADDYNYLGI